MLFVRKLFWLQLITDSDLVANVAAIAASVQQKRSNIYVTYLREKRSECTCKYIVRSNFLRFYYHALLRKFVGKANELNPV